MPTIPKVPVIEQIALAIATELAKISTTGSPADLVGTAGVVRRNLSGDNYTPANTLIVLDQGDTIPLSEEQQALTLCEWNTTFAAIYLIAQDKASTTPIDTTRNAAAAAILDHLLKPANAQWGGLAAGGTHQGEVVGFDTIGHKGFDGVTVAVQVLWRHVPGDACTAG